MYDGSLKLHRSPRTRRYVDAELFRITKILLVAPRCWIFVTAANGARWWVEGKGPGKSCDALGDVDMTTEHNFPPPLLCFDTDVLCTSTATRAPHYALLYLSMASVAGTYTHPVFELLLNFFVVFFRRGKVCMRLLRVLCGTAALQSAGLQHCSLLHCCTAARLFSARCAATLWPAVLCTPVLTLLALSGRRALFSC